MGNDQQPRPIHHTTLFCQASAQARRNHAQIVKRNRIHMIANQADRAAQAAWHDEYQGPCHSIKLKASGNYLTTLYTPQSSIYIMYCTAVPAPAEKN